MSQVYRPQATLPSLRANLDDDLPVTVGVVAPSKQARVDVRSLSRINYLEDRLAQQERNTNSLVDRAFKV